MNSANHKLANKIGPKFVNKECNKLREAAKVKMNQH